MPMKDVCPAVEAALPTDIMVPTAAQLAAITSSVLQIRDGLT